MTGQIRCYACRGFFDRKLSGCPECDAPRRGRNSYLETAKLNNHLYEQAERADNQRKAEAVYRAGGQLRGDPPAWAKARAKQLIEHL